jgi:uncharacterized repeat protein (TIGR01451 family)
MRIVLLLLLSTFFVLSANAQVVNIPDANFKNALLNHVPVINTNNDGEIQVSEAVAFTGTMSLFNKNISDLTGINAFINIHELYCPYNRLTTLNINGLNVLSSINCSTNLFSTLTIDNLPSLQILYCGSNLLTTLQLTNLPQLQELMCAQNKFTSLNLSGLPALKSINTQNCDSLTNLNVSGMPSLLSLNCAYCNISTLTMSGLTALSTLSCLGNKLTVITLSNPAVLQDLSASGNQLTALPVGLSALQNLAVENNRISVFALDNLNSLKTVRMFNNLCTSLILTNKPQLISIDCQNNLISNLQLSNLFSLRDLYCYQNQITSLTLNGFPSLESVRCYNNQLTSLTLSNTPKMKDFMCHNNQLTTLSLSNMPLLQWIQCQNNKLTNISLTNVPALYEIFCDNNKLTSLPFLNSISLPSLRSITFSGNRVPRLIVENHPVLEQIICDTNPIDSLKLRNLPNLSWFRIERTPLTSLTLDSLPKLRVLYCGKTDSLKNVSLKLPALEQFFCDSSKIVSADLSQTKVIQCIVPHNPLLQYLNLRNNTFGPSFYTNYNFSDNQSLRFICADDSEKVRIMDTVFRQLPGQGVTVSTICNYTPGVNSTIKGMLRMDYDLNGCNNADSVMMNVRLNNSDGTYPTSAFTNNLGQYIFHTSANTDTVTVAFEQPSWFNVSPAVQQIINIPNPGTTAIADFCVTPNGIHPDLEIILLPLSAARPGFNAQYKMVYRNKGNQLQSGTVTLNFDAVKLNFLSALPTVTSQTAGNLSWNYSGLTPYETRTITLLLHVNAPPVVNIGDILAFSAVVNPIAGDETTGDNTFTLNQVVRGAFDPNDKDVTEGSEIDISKAGDYLHYIIRFQNTGNDTAINVVIKDSLANNLDWNSLVPVDASHPCKTVISKGNKVEFIFDNINLPDKNINEPASHGFVSFKIKPKSSVTVGETINNKAEIYFDFNLPIVTNTVSTKIVTPKKSDNLIALSVYSNPVKDEIRFTVKAGSKIKAVNVYNTVGEKLYSETVTAPGTDRKVNIANLPTGMLFLQVITNGGTAVQKVIRIK